MNIELYDSYSEKLRLCYEVQRTEVLTFEEKEELEEEIKEYKEEMEKLLKGGKDE